MTSSPNVVVVNMFTPSYKNLNFKYPTQAVIKSGKQNK